MCVFFFFFFSDYKSGFIFIQYAVDMAIIQEQAGVEYKVPVKVQVSFPC